MTRRTSDSWNLRSASASDAGQDPPIDGAGAPLSERGARRVFGALCVIALAEGPVGPGARRELEEFQEFLGLSPAVGRLLERQAARGAGTLRIGKRPSELEFLMSAMIDVAAADGAMSRVARGLIWRVNDRARWSVDRVEDVIASALARARTRAAERAVQLGVDDSQEDSGLFEATLLPEPPRAARAASDSGLFEATLLPSAPRGRRATSFDDDPLDAAFDDADDAPAPARRRAPVGLEDSGEGELLVLGSPWFERDQ